MYRYQGDVSIRQGGFYFSVGKDETKNQYSSIVRVLPCSDAGGPDNMFWVETLMVNIPEKGTELFDIILRHNGSDADLLLKEKPSARFAFMVAACVSYGHYEPDDIFALDIPWSRIVQIGRNEPHVHGFNADIKLRDGASLRNWVKKNYLGRSHK